MKPIRRIFVALLSSALAMTALTPAARAADNEKPALLIFAAASLTNVLGELSTAWEKSSGVPVRTSFASSSVLARQIEAGGSVDVFISADQEWMDYLQARNLIDKSTRRNLVGNRLVLIAPADSKIELKIAPGFDAGGARSATDVWRPAIPTRCPWGVMRAPRCISLGVWDEIQDRLVRADNVRSAMMFVARGEVPLGIVYTTDALIDPKVRIVDTFPRIRTPRSPIRAQSS